MTKRSMILAGLAASLWAVFTPAAALAAPNLCVTRAGTAATAPQPTHLDDSTPYVFKTVDGQDLRLHVFSPKSDQFPGKHPVIIFYFGGAWMVGTVDAFVPQARYFASRGATVVLPEYRTFCRSGAGIVDEMNDAKDAVRWVRDHADELGVDPDRVVASGGSSGGQVALSTAMFDNLDPVKGRSAKPNLLVLFFPCVDETTEEERSYASDAIGAHGKDVSPLYNITPGLPPTIIFQGTADSLYSENKTYCERARAAGDRCEFVEYKDAPHGFADPRSSGGKWYLPVLLGMDNYLSRAGYLSPLADVVPVAQR
jgi:acetyl esterase